MANDPKAIVYELCSSKIRFGFGGEEKPMKTLHYKSQLKENIVTKGIVTNWNEMEKVRIIFPMIYIIIIITSSYTVCFMKNFVLLLKNIQ